MSEPEFVAMINALGYQGVPIKCTRVQWKGGLRNALQKQAAEWIDQSQDVRAILALEEIKRLDVLFEQDAL